MLNFILSLHTIMVPLILVAAGLALICGAALIIMTRQSAGGLPERPQDGDRVSTLRRIFRILLQVTAGLGVLQALFGGLLFLQGERPAEGLHFVYGLIVLGAIPVAYVYSDQKLVRRDIVIMSIAIVAVIGAAIRALATG
ncbi:MAG: hypothetical protein C5B60_09480 [Chloroflexi bacterium]|nr:MAG: hypothetical protein C5B60_09480 [Chloroflexota bacterium]